MTDYKSFSTMKKCSAIDKSLLRYAKDKNEEITILKTLLALRTDNLPE